LYIQLLFPVLLDVFPYQRWISGIAAIPFGISIAKIIKTKDEYKKNHIFIMFFLTILVIFQIYIFGFEITKGYSNVISYGAALIFIILAILLPNFKDKLTIFLTPLVFGVYLSHILFILLYWSIDYKISSVFLIGFIIFLTSVLFTFILRKTYFRNFV